MKSLFRAFDAEGVRHLVISGQETVRRFAPGMGRRFPEVRLLLQIWKHGREPRPAEFDRAARLVAARAQRLQAEGRRYWLPMIDELRRLRTSGRLLAEGTPAADLLQ